VKTITMQTIGSVSRAAAGGRSAPVEQIRGVKTHALLFGLDLDITIVGAGGGAVNAESTQRLIDLIVIKENGIPRVELTGRMLAYFTSRAQKQAANIGVLAGAGAQANTLVHADFVIDYASIYGADPAETAFVELDARFPTTIEVTWAADANAALISGTGLTLNSAALSISQMYDGASKLMPFFLPRIKRTTSKPITGVQSAFSIPLLPERQNRIESLVLHSLVDGVTSTALLTGQVTFRGDRVRFIDAVDRRTLLNEQRRFFDAPVPALSYLELNQRTYGKLSEMVVGNQDENLRVEAAVTGSGTTALIDVYSKELEVVPGYTRAIPEGW
jgi:hypothetical protein